MVVVAAAFTITTAHALVLTVSHGLLFANPLVCNGNCAAILLNTVTSCRAHLCGQVAHFSLHSSPYQRQMGPANVTHVRRPSARLRRCEPLGKRDISQMRAEPTELLGLNLGDPVCRPIRLRCSSFRFNWPARPSL
jgi:hypothetical protein